MRPVILFGGNNGAGKTTLFDAFRVVLYGKGALGERVSDAEYKSFLKNRIHRSPKSVLQPKGASITLEFDHTLLGDKNTYIVKREWINGNGKGVIEKLSIRKDGILLHNVNHDYWQGFVEEIIPDRISSLFFFDGEKIKSIADDAHGNIALADSIKTLLGLDIVERLSSDLNIYKSREALKFVSKDQEDDVVEIENNIKNIESQISLLREEIASNNTKQDGIRSEISSLEVKLKREGYFFAQQRDELKIDRKLIESRIEEIRRDIHKECEGVYPFSFCPSLSRLLVDQLANEKVSRKWRVLKDELLYMQNSLLEVISKISDNNFKNQYISSIEDCFIKRINDLQPAQDNDDYLMFSDEVSDRITQWIHSANHQSRPRFEALVAMLEEQTRQLQRLEEDLLKAPEDEILQPLVEELGIYNQRLGMKIVDQNRKEEDLRSLEFRLGVEQRKLKKLIDEGQARSEERGRVELAGRIQLAMKDYSDKLTKEKISQLRTTVAEQFNSLSRKGDLLKNIDIDPDTFSVTLADRYGNVLPKEDLSAGEKQMYAVAMLWGLSITSGRSLPVIIDTPLGRLDSEHRSKLIQNYFPNAGDQVIILSTDTEIDKQWYLELSSNVSHSYHLSYDKINNQTLVKNEYFWRG